MYGDVFKDEYIFPTLFTRGWGAYNSSFYWPNMANKKTMWTLKEYCKMTMFHCRRDRANHTNYLKIMFDRVFAEQFIAYNRGVPMGRKRDFNKKGNEKVTYKDAYGEKKQDPSNKENKNYYGTQMSNKMIMSPSYILEKRRDAHALFSHYRKAPYHKKCHDVWLTVTINTQDPRFKEFTKSKDGLKDKPAEVEIWFERMIKSPLLALLGCRKKTGDGLLGKVLGYFASTEWQGNGLPHLHIIMWLENRELLETGAFISTEEIKDNASEELYAAFKRQKHECRPKKCIQNELVGNQKCRLGYPKDFYEEEAIFDKEQCMF